MLNLGALKMELKLGTGNKNVVTFSTFPTGELLWPVKQMFFLTHLMLSEAHFWAPDVLKHIHFHV